MLQKTYRGTLRAFVEQWKTFTVHMAAIQKKAKDIEQSFNRVRLESAFMGFKISSKITNRDRRMAKMLMWIARKQLGKHFHRWICSTIRLAFLHRAAVKQNQAMAMKYRSRSFAAWRRVSKVTRARNSSLDMAVSLGARAGRRYCFTRWVKQTRYLRVMSNVEQRDLWVEQKYVREPTTDANNWSHQPLSLARAERAGGAYESANDRRHDRRRNVLFLRSHANDGRHDRRRNLLFLSSRADDRRHVRRRNLLVLSSRANDRRRNLLFLRSRANDRRRNLLFLRSPPNLPPPPLRVQVLLRVARLCEEVRQDVEGLRRHAAEDGRGPLREAGVQEMEEDDGRDQGQAERRNEDGADRDEGPGEQQLPTLGQPDDAGGDL
jgi:hypothetical protein